MMVHSKKVGYKMELSDAQRNALAWLSDSAYKDAEWRLRSHSGQDQSESEIYLEESRVYQTIIRGEEVNQAIHSSRVKFRQYVESNNRKVDDAPKIGSGPREGQSWIDHRWLDPSAFDRRINKILYKIDKAINDPEHVRTFKGRIEGHLANNLYPYLDAGLDPVHIYPKLDILLSASELGRLGGLAKSEAKAISSRENGKKGGRPRKVRGEKVEIESIDSSNLDLFGE